MATIEMFHRLWQKFVLCEFEGMVVAVLGREDNAGVFHVEDYCLPGLPYQVEPQLDQVLLDGEDR